MSAVNPSSAKPPLFLQDLDTDTTLQVFSFLTRKEIALFCRVNHYCNMIASTDILWAFAGSKTALNKIVGRLHVEDMVNSPAELMHKTQWFINKTLMNQICEFRCEFPFPRHEADQEGALPNCFFRLQCGFGDLNISDLHSSTPCEATHVCLYAKKLLPLQSDDESLPSSSASTIDSIQFDHFNDMALDGFTTHRHYLTSFDCFPDFFSYSNLYLTEEITGDRLSPGDYSLGGDDDSMIQGFCKLQYRLPVTRTESNILADKVMSMIRTRMRHEAEVRLHHIRHEAEIRLRHGEPARVEAAPNCIASFCFCQ